MKIKLLQIGKTKEKYLQEGIEEYQKRLGKYISFEIVTIDDIKLSKNLDINEIKDKEGEWLEKILKEGGKIILLDDKGKKMTSPQFATYIQTQLNASHKNVWFVIGGAYGFSQKIYSMAHEQLSLSEMTFSHQMVRLLFVEQLYRAFTILNNEPYHHM